MLEQYIGHINRLCCAADSKNWTDSNHCYDIAERTERVLLGLTDCKYGGQRVKRRVFNVLGEVSKIRFGTFDCVDAHCYNEQIQRSEQISESMTNRLKQQSCAVKW
jgi:hypothetical protein